MKNLKSYSFYFITNFIVRKICFVFLLSAVVIITNGFFISRASAESITESFVVVSGTDVSGDTPELLTTVDINRLSASDNESMQSNSGWPSDGAYDENKYLEFKFNANIPDGVNISNVSIVNEYYRSGTLLGAKLEFGNGTEIDLSLPSIVGYPGEVSETIDITQYIDNPSDLQNFTVKFLAYRGGEITTTKTGHDFIGLTVTYEEGGTVGNNFTQVIDNITEDTHWIKAESPYVVDFPVNIDVGATLFIEEGVVVKFDFEGGLIVEGKLEAEGLETDKIYFTSLQDDTVGGDTNNDGEESYPYKGDWDFILISAGENPSVFNNVEQRYSDDLGLVLYDGGSVVSNNYNLNSGAIFFGSDSSFSGMNASFIELYEGSNVSIEDANISSEEDDPISLFNVSSLELKDSTIEGNSSYLIGLYLGSEASIDGVEITGNSVYSTIFFVSEYSSLNIIDSSILKSKNGLEVAEHSILNAENLSVNCENDGVTLYDYSSLNLNKGNISCLHGGIVLFSEITADIKEVKINNALDSGVMAFSNFEPSPITITKSEISGNNYGFIVFDSNISVHQNSIHNNLTAGAITYDPFAPVNLDFTSNYWGDSSGPTHASNPDGIGDIVSDNIIFNPFLISDPLVIPTKNPVIIIPGITGTYLFKNYDDYKEIWPNIPKLITSLDDSFLNDLALRIDGTEDPEKPIVIGDIIRGVSSLGTHVFDNLIDELVDNGRYIENENLFVFPYDWRKSTTENALLLKEKIDETILNTGIPKVDIIAHSMGGLIAKKYVAEFLQDKVDNLIFLGTPQLGAPKAFKALMYGDDMGYNFIFEDIHILNPNRVKFISQNMPAVYELLPSEKYLDLNGSYIKDESNTGTGQTELDYEQTKDLMIEKGRNELMYPFAEDLHQNIDDLDISNTGIRAYNFVGCGFTTIGKITLKQKKLWKNLFFGWGDDYILKYVSGDETVPLVSATKAIGASPYYVKGTSHGSLPSADGVRENILSILKGEELQSFPNISTTASECGISGKIVSTHSPVELHIYDEEGNHTGPKENDEIEYGIDKVSYDQIEGENYAFLPDDVNYKIVTKATDTGGYSFMIESQNENENITSAYKWTLIPLKTLNSIGEIWIGPDYSPDQYFVKMDDEGDGMIDKNYSESYDGTAEAEAMIDSQNNHSKRSSGSIVLGLIKPEIKMPMLDQLQEKEVIKKLAKNEDRDFVSNETEELKIDQTETISENIIKTNLSASVSDSGAKVDLLWPVVILSGLIVTTLAKLFIKL